MGYCIICAPDRKTGSCQEPELPGTVLSLLFWPSCPVSSAQAGLSRFIRQVNMSRLTFPYCSLLMSCHNCPATDVQSWLSCPRAVLSWLPCPGCPATIVLSWLFQADVTWLPCTADPSGLICPGCPVPAVMPQPSCHCCPVKVALSCLCLTVVNCLYLSVICTIICS
jgi:hypothetical protein